MATTKTPMGIGAQLREWRTRRGLSQLELALDAGISARHLSFVETGRSKPGRELLLRITERLALPFRESNELLLAAGHAPAFPEHGLHDPELAPVREALELIISGHEPYPAVVVDRGWNVVAASSALQVLVQWIDPELLEPPMNAMRVGLHPRGVARWVINLGDVHAYFAGRLERQVALTGDAHLAALLEEVEGYPAPEPEHDPITEAAAGMILTPLMRFRNPAGGGELSFFATVAAFGTAAEVTTSELSIELAFPADAATAAALKELARSV
jgi:transcriptional regulator with XRE-family HTH domain